MNPFGLARVATDGALGFDCDTPLTAVQAMAFANAGYRWCARYLSRGEEAASDLEAVEVHAIHAVGIAVVPVQHVAVAGWYASAALGRTLGEWARQNAAQIGCPAGVTLWLDLEGVAPRCPASDIIAFCNAWTAEVQPGGHGTGLYVGASCGLTSAQLYHALSTKRYWRSLSHSTPDVDVRGYQIHQNSGGMLSGVAFDRDVITKDALGSLPVLWAPG